MSTTSHFGKKVSYNRIHYHSANCGSNWMAAECTYDVHSAAIAVNMKLQAIFYR
jgi:hypothetical protein